MLKPLISPAAILILGFWGLGTADEYIWPMKLPPELTSKFCDNRAGHFHAGLDIRTRGKTGYRVYAVADGHIFRVSTSFSGYGKAVYLRLDDGRIAVYGHLLRFDDSLDEKVRRIQMRAKRYRQDLYFQAGELPVRKGQLIGLSGSSGAGAPHLHFELRSTNNNPINPLRFGFPVNDRRPPHFDKLAVRVYHGGYDPGAPSNIEIIEPVYENGDYVIENPVYIDGYAVLAVSGGDLIDGGGFLYGFYSLELFVEDSLVFSSSADSVNYETTGQQDYLRDTELSVLAFPRAKKDNDRDIFYKLHIPRGAVQYFWKSELNSGIISPSSERGGKRAFRIIARDEAGNEAVMRGAMVNPALDPPAPEFTSFYRFGDSLEVDFLSFDTVGSCLLQFRNSIGSRFDTTECRLKTKIWNLGGEVAYLNSVWAAAPYDGKDYRLSFSNGSGGFSPWVYFADGTGKSGLELCGSPDFLRIVYYPDSIYTSLFVRLESSDQAIDAEMMQGGIRNFYLDVLDCSLEGDTRIEFRSYSGVIFDTSISLYRAQRGNVSRAASRDSILTLTIKERSMFYPTYIFPSAGHHASVMGAPALVFDIEPVNVLADEHILYRFDIERAGLAIGRAGVYGYAPANDKWGFIGSGPGRHIEVAGLGLGRLALIEDNDPPLISSVRPKGTIRSLRPMLSCVIVDDLSGINIDNGPQMWIDGIWVPAEYDIDSRTFTYQVHGNLDRTVHTLVIEAADNQGNISRKTARFSIR